MKLTRYLSALGYGSRREVERLLAAGDVRAEGRRLDVHTTVHLATDAPAPRTANGSVERGQRTAPNASVERGQRTAPNASVAHEQVRVGGAPLDPPPDSIVLLHKPAGIVCSTTDPNPVVYDLLPPRFRHRSPIMAPVGRLDRDTTGLLLLTDNGKLLHALTSPRSHLPKRYRVTLTEPFNAGHTAALTGGTLLLDGEHKPLAPAGLDRIGERELLLTITEGRYHQVRRMFAAVGHHVQSLHRESLGPLELGPLAEGEWRLLTATERELLEAALAEARAAARPGPGASPGAGSSRRESTDASPPAP